MLMQPSLANKIYLVQIFKSKIRLYIEKMPYS
jgi:hypothetical protein